MACAPASNGGYRLGHPVAVAVGDVYDHAVEALDRGDLLEVRPLDADGEEAVPGGTAHPIGVRLRVVHEAVDHAHPPRLGHRRRHLELRHGVHVRADDRQIQREVPDQPRPQGNVPARVHGRPAGHDQDIVERQPVLNKLHTHSGTEILPSVSL
jgi:hypothetical protein